MIFMLLAIGGALSIWGSIWAGLPLFLAAAVYELVLIRLRLVYVQQEKDSYPQIGELERKMEEQRAEMKKLTDKMNSISLAVGLKTINPS